VSLDILVGAFRHDVQHELRETEEIDLGAKLQVVR
jgi:hypothetical protein